MKKLWSLSLLVTVAIISCTKTTVLPIQNTTNISNQKNLLTKKVFNKPLGNFRTKGLNTSISEEGCSSAGGFSSQEKTGEIYYPFADWIPYGSNGEYGCISGKDYTGHYSQSESPRMCFSIKDWQSYYPKEKIKNLNDVAAILRKETADVYRYTGCYIPDNTPVIQPSGSGYGNPYGNPSGGSGGEIIGDSYYSKYGDSAFNTLSYPSDNCN